MYKHLPKKAKDIKGTVAIAELMRAHYIIAILSIAFAVMIAFVSAFQIQFDIALGFAAILLLGLLATLSLGTAFVLSKR
ncbi:MAG: hypothetical protein ABIP74_03655 [Candidatus Saccharimonas sp.]